MPAELRSPGTANVAELIPAKVLPGVILSRPLYRVGKDDNLPPDREGNIFIARAVTERIRDNAKGDAGMARASLALIANVLDVFGGCVLDPATDYPDDSRLENTPRVSGLDAPIRSPVTQATRRRVTATPQDSGATVAPIKNEYMDRDSLLAALED